MSTNSLKAHKKVASVEVNDAGKATRLTLKAPWVYDAGDGKGALRGPFDLTNVEHGHKITKAAYHEDKGPPVAKAPVDPTPGPAPVAPFGGQRATPVAEVDDFKVIDLQPMEPPTRPFLTWRAIAQSDHGDIMFWFWTYRRQPILDIEREARKTFNLHIVREGLNKKLDWQIFVRGYLAEDEAKRPSPWHDLRKEFGEP